MACDNHEHEYLYWDGVTVHSLAEFLDAHLLHRLKFGDNPLEFPAGQTTAYSCKWSYIIRNEHILVVDRPPLGDNYESILISDVKSVTILKYRDDEPNNGWHKLMCIPSHAPNDCDNSHSEILIQHCIYNDEDCTDCIFDKTYTYEFWNSGDCILAGNGKFYKRLRTDYRKEVISKFTSVVN